MSCGVEQSRAVRDGMEVLPSHRGEPTCRVRGVDGRWRYLHSRYDPDGEARQAVGALQIRPGELVVLLGVGLGYWLRALLDRFPEHPIAAVERDPALYLQAVTEGILLKAIDRSGVTLLPGLPVEDALEGLQRIRRHYGSPPLRVVVHPVSKASFPGYYAELERVLLAEGRSILERELEYPRFRSERAGVLLLDSGYFMIRELGRAFSQMGHRLFRLDIRVRRPDFIETLLQGLARWKPDFLLTVNHLGFDEGGRLTALLTDLRIPFASWFVDSPELILRHPEPQRSPYGVLFTWERTDVDRLRAGGFEHVYYLPLATDPLVFHPRQRGSGTGGCPVGFVGSSMVEPEAAWSQKVPWTDALRPVAEQAVRRKLADRRLPMSEILAECKQPRDLDLEAALLWQATRQYRLDLLRALAPLGLRIHGDDGWRGLLPPEAVWGPPLHYYRELPRFYASSRVHVNATSLQMPTALNQRVFDVSACGGFLLTDYQEDMDLWFRVGEEAVCYRHPEEARDLASYYLSRETERRALAVRARERVLQEHTYQHRMDRMIRVMRRLFQ